MTAYVSGIFVFLLLLLFQTAELPAQERAKEMVPSTGGRSPAAQTGSSEQSRIRATLERLEGRFEVVDHRLEEIGRQLGRTPWWRIGGTFLSGAAAGIAIFIATWSVVAARRSSRYTYLGN